MDQKENIMKASNDATKVKPPHPSILDSGSTLYDSFELDSFKRQLDSAISARSLSMPHLDPSSISARTFSMPRLRENRRHDPSLTSSSSTSSSGAKKQFWLKVPRSMQKLFRSVFGLKRSGKRSGSAWGNGGRVFVVYEKTATLSTIPEGPEAADCDGFSPDVRAVVRRTASERIPAAAVVGITVACAN
ncbi:hypothetical protein Droror1_Dr00005444 [Drosera rotundifolia]